MTYSMTAFASIQKQLDAGILCWEIKSVNHRYLDISFRLPEAFRFLETSLRSIIRSKVSRGKLECQLQFLEQSSNGNQSIRINHGLVDELLDTAHELSVSKHLANDMALSNILMWPGVVQTTQPDLDFLVKETELLFEEALLQLLAARKSEGFALQKFTQNRLEKLRLEVKAVEVHLTSQAEQYRNKLLSRLSSLQLEVDNSRLEQEIALLLVRGDVSEELDRLLTHIVEIAKILETDEASGRRLDFLMQELNREANTLGSKADSVVLTQRTVEMKVLIEQMREQIQNIE